MLIETERRITDLGLQRISSGLLPIGTVLLSSRAPIGYLAIAEVPVAVNQGFIAMICDGDLPNLYVLHWARENLPTIIGNANGTTFLEISKRNFRPIRALVPPRPVLDHFIKMVGPLHQRIAANIRESRTLAALRDVLLPKLLSGEIRVKDIEESRSEVEPQSVILNCVKITPVVAMSTAANRAGEADWPHLEVVVQFGGLDDPAFKDRRWDLSL